MNLECYQPTLIQKLSGKLNNNNFYIKRDDLLPLSFGGNKARKAVLFFDDLEKNQSDCVVTYGSSSSNHCRIIANIAASRDIPCYIISPSESSKVTFNSQMMNIFDARIVQCSVSDVKVTIQETIENLIKKGYKPYFIQGGGHGILGTQAYVNAYEEVVSYEKETGIYFDYIFSASGTGTTQAGLICGKVLNNDTRQIIGISNARKSPHGEKVVLDSVNEYLLCINGSPVAADEISFIDDYVLNGYSSFNKEILGTIRRILIYDGVSLDTTYTGKAFWGMEEHIKKNKITNKNILFIHTGGTPLFFNDLEELIRW